MIKILKKTLLNKEKIDFSDEMLFKKEDSW